jgi:hypothetical protein
VPADKRAQAMEGLNPTQTSTLPACPRPLILGTNGAIRVPAAVRGSAIDLSSVLAIWPCSMTMIVWPYCNDRTVAEVALTQDDYISMNGMPSSMLQPVSRNGTFYSPGTWSHSKASQARDVRSLCSERKPRCRPAPISLFVAPGGARHQLLEPAPELECPATCGECPICSNPQDFSDGLGDYCDRFVAREAAIQSRNNFQLIANSVRY